MGKSQARNAQAAAEMQAAQERAYRMSSEERLKKERERSQRLFIRKLRARLGGGFYPADEQKTTLG